MFTFWYIYLFYKHFLLFIFFKISKNRGKSLWNVDLPKSLIFSTQFFIVSATYTLIIGFLPLPLILMPSDRSTVRFSANFLLVKYSSVKQCSAKCLAGSVWSFYGVSEKHLKLSPFVKIRSDYLNCPREFAISFNSGIINYGNLLPYTVLGKVEGVRCSAILWGKLSSIIRESARMFRPSKIVPCTPTPPPPIPLNVAFFLNRSQDSWIHTSLEK